MTHSFHVVGTQLEFEGPFYIRIDHNFNVKTNQLFLFLNHYYCYYHYCLIQWSLYYEANQFAEKFWPYIGVTT